MRGRVTTASDTALLLTVPQAAELLQISCDLAYQLVARGELPHIRLGMAGRVIRVPRFGLEQWIAREAGVPAARDGPPARGSAALGGLICVTH
ncbi:MAG: helix-turn-helix domain-containing protein [Deltaproteobacteria bacterium]|nr:helix-turn-helix domain-containing protein [Chloroflexota bacterium]MBI3304050.1 helix-turn-helix domain-containing protein [Deltaproteobacteria bacterium]